MADKKISELTELTIPTASDELAIVNTNETKRVSYANLMNVPPTYTAPNALNLVVGDSANGIADLQTMLDGNTYRLEEVAGVPGFDLRLTFVNMDAVCTIVSRFYYVGSATHGSRIQLYNVSTTNWDTFSTVVGNDVDYTLFQICIIDDSDYIDAGTVIVRFYHTENGNASHDLYIDYIALSSVQ